MFKKLSVNQWRQIDEVDIEFDRDLTVLTGANGSGKTTILNILSQHFGWNFSFVSKPYKDEKGELSYLKSFWQFDNKGARIPAEELYGDRTTIGKVELYDGDTEKVTARSGSNATYNVNIGLANKVEGVHIPSHRHLSNYESVNNIPTEAKDRDKAYGEYKNNVTQRITRDRINQNPIYHIKETLISWATLGYGNEKVQGDVRAVELFEGFQEILDNILPDELGFQEVEVRVPEVVLITESGEFALDAVSGGISSIIGIAWQIYLFNPDKENFVVTIDEPENHLHPSLQRSLLPSLIKTFPNVQFVVATHSPLIVGSSKSSRVYVLTFDDDNKVSSQHLESARKSGTSNEILRDVLGVSSTMPIWVADTLDNIMSKYSDMELDEENIDKLADELKERGIENKITDLILRIQNDQR